MIRKSSRFVFFFLDKKFIKVEFGLVVFGCFDWNLEREVYFVL